MFYQCPKISSTKLTPEYRKLAAENELLLAENAELKRRVEAAIAKVDAKHSRLEKTLRYINDPYYGGQLDAYYQAHDWLNEILRPEEP
jgi:hypothetical protein